MSNKARIFVVAHEPKWKNFVADVLSPKYDVHLCHDPEFALQEIRDNDFDLIIVDVLVEDLLEALYEEKVRRRLLVVSAHPSVSEAIRAYRLGALDYANKAFGETSLLVMIENILQKKPAQKRERDNTGDGFMVSILTSSCP
jgi:DNA-binding NtrC family response regulator